MGKLCMESWVPPSRQGSPADVGRGTRSSPRGKRALYLAATRMLLSRGQEMPGQPGFCLRSITVGRAFCRAQPRLPSWVNHGRLVGLGAALGRVWAVPEHSPPCSIAGTGAQDSAGGMQSRGTFGVLGHWHTPTHRGLPFSFVLVWGVLVSGVEKKRSRHCFFTRHEQPKPPQQTEQVAAASNHARLHNSFATKGFR